MFTKKLVTEKMKIVNGESTLTLASTTPKITVNKNEVMKYLSELNIKKKDVTLGFGQTVVGTGCMTIDFNYDISRESADNIVDKMRDDLDKNPCVRSVTVHHTKGSFPRIFVNFIGLFK